MYLTAPFLLIKSKVHILFVFNFLEKQRAAKIVISKCDFLLNVKLTFNWLLQILCLHKTMIRVIIYL